MVNCFKFLKSNPVKAGRALSSVRKAEDQDRHTQVRARSKHLTAAAVLLSHATMLIQIAKEFKRLWSKHYSLFMESLPKQEPE